MSEDHLLSLDFLSLRARVAELERERDEARAELEREEHEHNATERKDFDDFMALQAQCAAMRAALESTYQAFREAGLDESFTVADAVAQAALATGAGRRLLERVERYERALTEIREWGEAKDALSPLGQAKTMLSIARAALAEPEKEGE